MLCLLIEQHSLLQQKRRPLDQVRDRLRLGNDACWAEKSYLYCFYYSCFHNFLLVNSPWYKPRTQLVQTGLDLVSFHTVVFYELEYSFSTLWKDFRRVWRLCQPRSVKAMFNVYKDAIEDQAYALMWH